MIFSQMKERKEEIIKINVYTSYTNTNKKRIEERYRHSSKVSSCAHIKERKKAIKNL